MTGTARKNVNSAAATLDTPKSNAPMMVAPEREVPGMIESTWNIPMKKAVLYVISFSVSTLGVLVLFQFSITINATP